MYALQQQEYVNLIESSLKKYLPQKDVLYAQLLDAMRYSLLNAGKRIRPILVLEFCRLCGGKTAQAIPFACAVEMIHTYSLIHDDLPCMDNDDMRRGRASNHKVYGEDIALLAGDALLTMAFEVMVSREAVQLVGAGCATEATHTLACAAGKSGMVAGQVIDLQSEGKKISIATLKKMDECKTGALIEAASTIGCIIGSATENQIEAAKKFSQAIGLAFQIQDDILDVIGSTETLGKKTGSDSANSKCTYVSLLGMEQATSLVNELTKAAIKALSVFDGDTSYLCHLAENLAKRTN